MLIFLYGPDTYRSRQKLNAIIDRYKKIHKSGLSLKYFDGEDLNFQDFKDRIQSISMFQEKKLIVLENSFSNLDFKRKFLENSGKFINSKPSTRAELGAGPVPHRNEVSGAGDIILFYEENQIPENDSLFIFLKKSAKSQEFKLLGGQRLKDWAKKEFAKYQCQIGEKTLEKLIEFIGNDLWRLTNEIKKLVNFKTEIKVKDIELLVKPKIEAEIFKTIDALASRNKKQALALIHRHLEKGDSPLYLLSMINFQFRNLLMLKSYELGCEFNANYANMRMISQRLRLHPFIIKKSISQARNFSFEELKKIYQKIFQADLDIKTGKIEPETALDLLIAEI